MAYDFKKEYRDLYVPKARPSLVDVPAMTFAAMAGTGDPNEEGGAYQRALGVLYGFSYTVKMAKMGDWQPEGYFDYVVPPLEGLWWAGSGAFDGASIADKGALSWVSLIRQPDFVTPEAFERACGIMVAKKPELADAVEEGELRLVRFAEGPCAQIMHKGPMTTSLRRSPASRISSRRRALPPTSRREGSRLRGIAPRKRSTPLPCSMRSIPPAPCRRSGCITRSTSGIRAAPSRKTSRP